MYLKEEKVKSVTSSIESFVVRTHQPCEYVFNEAIDPRTHKPLRLMFYPLGNNKFSLSRGRNNILDSAKLESCVSVALAIVEAVKAQ